jgi:hypothetical protein
MIQDQGPEFTAPPFQTVLIRNGIGPVSITVKSPKVNAVCEHSHGTINNQLCTIFHSNPPQDIGGAIDAYINSAIVSTGHGTSNIFCSSETQLVV